MRQRLQALTSKYFRYPRHLLALLQHAGPRRTANVLLAEWERVQRATVLRSRPYYYIIDPCNVCNLRCPLCPTGTNELKRRQAMMSLNEYRTILDKIAPYAVEVSLHNWGEPLLNKDIFAIIRATRQRGIATNMSSNLSLERPQLAEQLVDSGLEYLIVSLDGATQEVYGTYRRRGSIELVMNNLRALVAAKRAAGSKTPIIEWQYLVFKHNEHEMDRARQLADEIGVDRLRFRSPGLPYMHIDDVRLGDDWMPSNPAYWDLHPARLREQGYLWDEPCYYLYRSMTVNPGGGVAACCIVYHERQDFGCLLHDDLDTIWNSPRYQASRALFGRQPGGRAGSICDGCYIFKRPRPARGRETLPLAGEAAQRPAAMSVGTVAGDGQATGE